jgi:hypothetical protein
VKAYYRKSKALFEMVDTPGNDIAAIDSMQKGLELAQQQSSDPELVEEIERMLAEAEDEHTLDTTIPLEHPERRRFNKMFDWLKDNGAEFPKLKMRYYTEDYRGVHASREILKGETILLVPKDCLLTLDMAM